MVWTSEILEVTAVVRYGDPMEGTTRRQSMRARVLTVLKGGEPDRLPFIDRLELWHKGLTRTGALPPEFRGMTLTQIHQTVGMGQQRFLCPYGFRLRGVEMISKFEGKIVFHETDPIVERFPDVDYLAPADEPGVLTTEVRTPSGTLTIEHTMLEQMLRSGTRSYMSQHPIKGEGDYRAVEYVVEHSEFAAHYEKLYAVEVEIGEIGYVVPVLGRIPFQDLLVDYFGTTPMFYALHDSPHAVMRLLTLLDQRMMETLRNLRSLNRPYVEFIDNLDGLTANPSLFSEHCLPSYQRYTEILHQQEKRVGSHTDGNIRPLLFLLAESGLDVCESFSPSPLTSCTFKEAWEAWRGGPIIWGGIPSPILEERTSEGEFRAYIDQLLETIGDRPIILGVGDMVLPNNSIERVRHIAQLLERGTRG